MCRRLLTRGCLIAGAALLLCAFDGGTANATFTEYLGVNLSPGNSVTGDPKTQHDAFVTALGTIGVDSFETTTGSGSAGDPFALSFTGSDGPVTGSLVANDTADLRTAVANGQFPTSGSQYLFTQLGFTITFSVPVSAFGFYATDLGDGRASLELVLNGDTPRTVQLSTSGNADGALLFWGFIDDTNSYSSIAFNHTNSAFTSPESDGVGYDDLTIAGAAVLKVPEPGTFGLFGLALCGMLAAARCRQRRPWSSGSPRLFPAFSVSRPGSGAESA